MDASKFLSLVLEHRKTNPNHLKEKTGSPAIQSAASRLLSGAVKSPRKATVSPLADALGVNVEAFLSSAVALSELQRLNIAVPGETQSATGMVAGAPVASLPARTLSSIEAFEVFARSVNALPPAKRRRVMDSAGAYAENLSDLNEREYVVRELSGESQREEPKSKRVLRR